MHLEEAPVTASRDLEFDRIMGKITRKASQINKAGIMPDDREILKERLQSAWSEDPMPKERQL